MSAKIITVDLKYPTASRLPRKMPRRTAFLRKMRKALPKKKKPAKTKIGLWREWLVPDGAYHRFEGLRGIYWYWLSRDIRKSEWEKYGVCITCLRPIEDWRYADCGHILPASNCGEYLVLNRLNLTIQHKPCNNPKFSPHAGIQNAINMNARHGQGYMENLFALKETYKGTKPPKTEEYKTLIRSLSSYQEAKKKHDLSV